MVRNEGAGYSFEEFTVGIVGIATPVLTETGFPAGALNVAMPTVRYSTNVRDRAVDVLKRASRQLSEQLIRAGRSAARSDQEPRARRVTMGNGHPKMAQRKARRGSD
jgi:hypothetical protein